jgi:DNA-binding PadR family transcriptional regulator
MVATSNKEKLEILTVRTREDILRLLFDDEPRSAYKIAKEINMSTATVIDHLNRLEDVKLINSEDTTKGNLRRKSYKITEKGKKTLLTFLKTYMEDVKKNEEIAKEVASFLGKV